jgi:hypothetical protein
VTPIWEFRIILPLSYLGKSQKSAKFDWDIWLPLVYLRSM